MNTTLNENNFMEIKRLISPAVKCQEKNELIFNFFVPATSVVSSLNCRMVYNVATGLVPAFS